MAQPRLDDNTVYLIDGSGYIFRAYFAIRSLHSKSGVPTNAVYGFTNMLLKLLKEHKPKYLAIAFDRKEPTFRHEIYPEYKGNRPAPPEDLVPQFDLIHQVVRAFNIKLLSMAGFEADDLIATMRRRALEEGRDVVIVTGDKDFMQLVDERTFLLDELRAARVGTEEFIDIKHVKDEMGVLPQYVVDLLALAGDASDNVPGVAGIGKKTAAELINEFGPLERILEMAPLVKQKSRREKLIDGHNFALLSKKLVTIDDNAPIDYVISDLKYSGIDQEKAKSLFLQLDFNRLLQDSAIFKAQLKADGEITRDKPVEDPIKKNTYQTVTDSETLEKLVKSIGHKKVALATLIEQNSPPNTPIIGISLSWDEHQAAYIPIGHSDGTPQLSLETVRPILGNLLSDKTTSIIAHHAKVDHKVLTTHGFPEFTIGGDPMLESYLLHQDQEKHSLEDLAVKHLDYRTTSLEELRGIKKTQIPFADVPVAKASMFAAERADLVRRLEGFLLQKIEESRLTKLYRELELPLEEVLSRMERHGVRIDKDILHRVGDELKSRLALLETQAHELAGMKFNLGSPKQIGEILFEKLALPTVKKTKTGFSTDSSVLEKLKGQHPLADILLEHRVYAKLINTYIETLPLLVDAKTGRIHTTYNQFVAATGRLSSSDPNLQNIPARTIEGRRIRQAFVAKPGYRLISLDYSQVELRLLALITRDAVLLDSFARDQDVHRRTASEIFDVAPESVTKQQRDAAKTINFGLLYGMGVHRLAQTLNISRKEAQSYLDKYFDKYAGVFRWKNDALTEARQNNEVRTLFGRKRSLPELSSKNGMERARGERIAINTPIQGTAADIIKKAMIDTDAFLKNDGTDAHLIMQVHDELVIEAPVDDAERIATAVARIMSHGHGLDCELKVDYGIAENWDAAH